MNLDTFFENFELFADAPNAVAKIRELVLELATSGRLSEHIEAIWEEKTLDDVIELISGQHLLANEHNTQGRGIPYLTGPADFGPVHPIPTRWTETPKVVAEPGDILITVKGAGIGKTNVLTGQKTAISRQLMAIRVRGADPAFVHLLIRRAAEVFQESKTGIAIPGIGRKDVLSLKIKLPPLAEQKRIVAKVDELMALCDRLEAQQRERETRHTALAHASLTRFADAPTPADLELLFHKSYSIEPAELRKSILTLAVRGKLVAQDAAEESGSDLLISIGRHNGNRILKAVPQGPHEIPESWVWAKFGEIIISRDSERVPVSKEERATRAKVYDYYGASGIIDKIDGYLFDKTLLLIGEDGANLINRSTPIAFLAMGKYWVNNHAHVLDGISDEFLRYIAVYINSIDLRPYVTGSAQPKMNQAKMNSIPVPLPPLPEQKRIVAKVDQLMALVDRLEAQLAESRRKAAALLEAVVAELSAAA